MYANTPPHVVEPTERKPGIFSFKEVCRWLRHSGALKGWLQRRGIHGLPRTYLEVLRRLEGDDHTDNAWRQVCVLVKRRSKAQDLRDTCVFILIGLLKTFFDADAASAGKKKIPLRSGSIKAISLNSSDDWRTSRGAQSRQ
jgi:hypothetical protein